ncbi:MAG: daptomycin-sensing surface protein LiaX [Alkalibacterium sp.]|nr:daptomycin-sensing surface protein LiaX [Alkalibacterium sp.]
MNERERILELMKKGIISTEEGLDLLESIANKEDLKQEDAVFTSDDSDVEKETETKQDEDDNQKQAEEDLEQLVSEINQYSVELDTINVKLSENRKALELKKETAARLETSGKESIQEEKNRIIEKIKMIQKELELIKQLDEVDTTDEIITLRNEINELDKELTNVENLESVKDDGDDEQLKKEIRDLEETVNDLSAQKADLMKKLNKSKMKQWTLKAKQATSQFEIPEDWEKKASEEFSKAGEKLDAASKEWSKLFKSKVDKASKSDLSETVRSNIENAMSHFDWKDINLKVPALSSRDFSKEWQYDHTTATILDFKLANGKVVLKPGSDETVSFKAKGKLYGKMDEETPEESFDARSTVTIDEDKLVCHVPNKRVYVDLEVTLPKRTYDYISITMLNGKLSVENLDAKDVFAKSTNGSLSFDRLNATMLEVKGSNGTITIKDSDLKDVLAGSVNGSILFKGKTESADFTTTNGEIKVTLTDKKVVRLNATTVNGSVKLALPKGRAIEGKAKTTFGKVKSRLSDTEPIDKVEHTMYIKRVTGDTPLDFFAGSTTGNILIKDTDQ